MYCTESGILEKVWKYVPDLEKVWKMTIKSRKTGKKLEFLKAEISAFETAK